MIRFQLRQLLPMIPWRGIYSKRSCWIAQADLWNPLLRLIINEIGGTKDLLPCADGSCPFEKDASLRLEVGKDPNPSLPASCRIKWNQT